MAWEARSGLKHGRLEVRRCWAFGLNGLGSPFGIETAIMGYTNAMVVQAKWPGKPVRD